MASNWIMIISEADKAEANTMTGQESFKVGLSATGNAPATHYLTGFHDYFKNIVYPQLSTLNSFDMVEQVIGVTDTPICPEILESRSLKQLSGGSEPPHE